MTMRQSASPAGFIMSSPAHLSSPGRGWRVKPVPDWLRRTGGLDAAFYYRRLSSFPLDHHFFFQSALGTGVRLHHPAELPMRAAAGDAPTELEASRTALPLRV